MSEDVVIKVQYVDLHKAAAEKKSFFLPRIISVIPLVTKSVFCLIICLQCM
jgi:hypothetical protein